MRKELEHQFGEDVMRVVDQLCTEYKAKQPRRPSTAKEAYDTYLALYKDDREALVQTGLHMLNLEASPRRGHPRVKYRKLEEELMSLFLFALGREKRGNMQRAIDATVEVIGNLYSIDTGIDRQAVRDRYGKNRKWKAAYQKERGIKLISRSVEMLRKRASSKF